MSCFWKIDCLCLNHSSAGAAPDVPGSPIPPGASTLIQSGYRHDTITHARTIVTASSNSAMTLSLTPRAFTRPVRAW
jgi:hypothetical protein